MGKTSPIGSRPDRQIRAGLAPLGLTAFGRHVLFERARLAAIDPDGEQEAAAPLSEVQARQIVLELAATERRSDMRNDDGRELLERLGVDATRTRGVVRCPAHRDRSPSLSWRFERGQTLLHCFAGCTFDEIRAAIR